MTLSLYIDRPSPVHACPATVKLAALVAVGVLVFFLSNLWYLGGILLGSVALAILTRIPVRYLAQRCLPFLAMIVVFFLAHAVLTAVETGLVTVTRFAIMILLSLVLAMTTRLSALVATLERLLAPLRVFGIDPEKAGLVLSMTIRFIPLIAEIYREIAAAQKARGLERNVLALIVPLFVRLLQRAETISDALTARGVGD